MRNYIGESFNKIKDYFTFLGEDGIFNASRKLVSSHEDEIVVLDKKTKESREPGCSYKKDNEYFFPIKYISTSADHCNWYIGKLFKDEQLRAQSPYNDNFIIFSL